KGTLERFYSWLCSSSSSPSLQVRDDAAVDLAIFHAREDVVDAVQLVPGEVGRYGSAAGEGQRLFQILARSDDRAADGDALENHVEDRQRHLARRQTNQRHRAARPQHVESLFEGLR